MPAHDGEGRLMAPGGRFMAEIDISWTEGERGNIAERFDLIYFEPVDHIANMMLFRHSRYQPVNR